MGRLDGKVILVTGAAAGLGREYAQRLAQEGAKLVLADIEDCRETARRCEAAAQGAEVLTLNVDVADEAQTREMAAKAHERFGRIDGLLNNAGLMRGLAVKSLLDVDMELWDRVYAVNARGTFLCIRAVFPYMRDAGGGTVVNVGSGSTLRIARTVDSTNPHYTSSKAAIANITRAVARELGAYNINVVTLAPGSTTSDRDQPLGVADADDEPAASLQRRGVPADLTGVVAFLFSEDAHFISGQMIVVNGGREVY
ncbi:MAG: SDR family oxidoreductase [Alphaproteobacteria bacterium]|nr:SDR family oxidoreductase [Alphaproteobacteria bacterium]